MALSFTQNFRDLGVLVFEHGPQEKSSPLARCQTLQHQKKRLAGEIRKRVRRQTLLGAATITDIVVFPRDGNERRHANLISNRVGQPIGC
jgi:hypothetical protein